jgi:hypothetical protein
MRAHLQAWDDSRRPLNDLCAVGLGAGVSVDLSVNSSSSLLQALLLLEDQLQAVMLVLDAMHLSNQQVHAILRAIAICWHVRHKMKKKRGLHWCVLAA